MDGLISLAPTADASCGNSLVEYSAYSTIIFLVFNMDDWMGQYFKYSNDSIGIFFGYLQLRQLVFGQLQVIGEIMIEHKMNSKKKNYLNKNNRTYPVPITRASQSQVGHKERDIYIFLDFNKDCRTSLPPVAEEILLKSKIDSNIFFFQFSLNMVEHLPCRGNFLDST